MRCDKKRCKIKIRSTRIFFIVNRPILSMFLCLGNCYCDLKYSNMLGERLQNYF